MVKVIFDSETLQSLGNLDEAIEVCDESGRTMGRILPKEEYDQLIQDWVKTRFTPAEIERARRQFGERALEKLLERSAEGEGEQSASQPKS